MGKETRSEHYCSCQCLAYVHYIHIQIYIYIYTCIYIHSLHECLAEKGRFRAFMGLPLPPIRRQRPKFFWWEKEILSCWGEEPAIWRMPQCSIYLGPSRQPHLCRGGGRQSLRTAGQSLCGGWSCGHRLAVRTDASSVLRTVLSSPDWGVGSPKGARCIHSNRELVGVRAKEDRGSVMGGRIEEGDP